MRIWFGFEIFMNKNRKGRSKNGDSLKEKEKKKIRLVKEKIVEWETKQGFGEEYDQMWERERQTALLWFLLIATSVYLSLSFFCFFFSFDS